MANKKKGKYADVMEGLPHFSNVEPEREDVIREIQRRIKTAPVRPTIEGNGHVPSDSETVDNILNIVHHYLEDIYDIEETTTQGKQYATEYARVYAELRKVISSLGEEQWKLGLLLEAYQGLMIDQFETEGVSSLKLSNGQPVTTYEEPYPQVEDKEAFRQWCIKQGLERKMSLHPSTTTSMVKEMLLAGDPEPDGIKIYVKTRVRLGAED